MLLFKLDDLGDTEVPVSTFIQKEIMSSQMIILG